MNMSNHSNDETRWAYLVALEEEFLRGGHLLNEYAVELLRNAHTCYASGAFVAGIVMAAAAVETWLRAEPGARSDASFNELILNSRLPGDIIDEMHTLRKGRNRLVHVRDAENDLDMINEFDASYPNLEPECKLAMRTVYRVLFSCPWV